MLTSKNVVQVAGRNTSGGRMSCMSRRERKSEATSGRDHQISQGSLEGTPLRKPS